MRSTNYAGVVEETVFDEKGREIKKIKYNLDDPINKMYTESKRDDKGVVTADVDESGKYDSVKYTYDHNGEVSVKTDGKGNKTAYGYKDGQLVSISGDNEGERSTNTMSYTASLLTKSSNGDTDYNYSYDGWGRSVKVEIAGEKYSETHYIADNLSNVVLANGDIHEVRTDKYGNTERKSVTYADGSCEHVTNEYDKETQRLSKITIDNSEQGEYNISYSYDSKGHVIEEVRGGENPLEKKFDYTIDGDMKESVYKVVKDASAEEDKDKYETLTYAYETDHTPDRRDANVELPYGISQQFAYDGLGRTRGITLGQVLAKDVYYQGFGDHTTNRVSSVWYGVNGIRKDNNKYTYDKAGNIATITENGLEAAKYVYDGLNRLVRENNSTMGKTSVVYDAAGNILYKTVNGRRTKYRYSQNGWKDQLISLTEGDQTFNFEYDVLGNPTLYKDVPMQWKGRRLTSYNGVSYAYDVNGIRTSKVRNGIEYKYIYDGNNLIAEQHIQGSNSEWIYYLYGVDGVAGFRYNETTYLYRKNVQGDVTHIYTESGEQVAHYAYDAWGNVQILQDRNEIATINPFRYRSYYFDEESKFYYLQTRYYDPALGRFISADSIEYLDPETIGGLNLYAYCGNNPVMGYDPEGTFDWDKFWRSIGTFVVAAVILAVAVAVCIVTVGSAAPVLIGAGVGFLIGAATSVATQAIFNDGQVDWYKVILDGFVGAISGAVAVTGIGIWGSAAVGGILGGLSSVGEDVIDGNKPDPGKFWLSVGIGFIGGLISGSGADAKKLDGIYKTSKNVLKTAVSASKQSTYKAKITMVKKIAAICAARFSASVVTCNGLSKWLGNLLFGGNN